MTIENHQRFHVAHAHLGKPFGSDRFGKLAEVTARFLGTPQYLIGQSLIVLLWVAINAIRLTGFDPYPFILLNLAFSLQSAYAAPLILLAETRQADRDKAWSDADARHREDIAGTTLTLLEQNTELTRQVQAMSEQISNLTQQVHAVVCVHPPADRGSDY